MTREEIIKGLGKIGDFFRARADMAVGDGKMLLLNWMKCAEEAAEAMKSQEARVLTAAEMEQWDNDVWIENFNENRIYVIDKSIAGFAIACMRGRYRCWTSRPTDEQREAVKWECG